MFASEQNSHVHGQERMQAHTVKMGGMRVMDDHLHPPAAAVLQRTGVSEFTPCTISRQSTWFLH